ncbi:MAG: PQQ-dependent sugar dehydrogenase [Acidobacteriota bacterium]
MTRLALRTIIFCTFVVASATSALAGIVEVSAPGETPFRPYKLQDWVWEDLTADPALTYSLHRSVTPVTGYTRILEAHPTAAWAGDPTDPATEGTNLFFYLVTAHDATTDSSAGMGTDGTPREVENPPRQGSCCVMDACTVETADDCAMMGGNYGGDGTDCMGDPCTPMGACCRMNLCTVETEAGCVGFGGGTYLGDGTDCMGDPCTPTGACCVMDACTVQTEMNCLGMGGAYQGDGTDCMGDPCAPMVGCLSGETPETTPTNLMWEDIGVSFGGDDPIAAEARPGDLRSLYVLERSGQLRIVRDDVLMPGNVVDLSGVIDGGFERGALGFAFHPDHETNGLFYIHHSVFSFPGCNGADHCARISEFQLDPADATTIVAGSERVVMELEQPAGNHNGGWIGFSPVDGFLYISFGDGGGGGDTFNAGQDLTTWLGKILRIDVDGRGAGEYSVPADNPYVGMIGVLPEIYSYGLRNAWRCSFDRTNGDFYSADVGQGAWEEVNHVTAASGGGSGINYGWSCREGAHPFGGGFCPDPMASFTEPVHEYPRSLVSASGCASITGGYAYRGCRMEWLTDMGLYFFGDYCSGDVWSIQSDGMTMVMRDDWGNSLDVPGFSLISFAEDGDGELLALLDNGTIRRLVPAP